MWFRVTRSRGKVFLICGLLHFDTSSPNPAAFLLILRPLPTGTSVYLHQHKTQDLTNKRMVIQRVFHTTTPIGHWDFVATPSGWHERAYSSTEVLPMFLSFTATWFCLGSVYMLQYLT